MIYIFIYTARITELRVGGVPNLCEDLRNHLIAPMRIHGPIKNTTHTVAPSLFFLHRCVSVSPQLLQHLARSPELLRVLLCNSIVILIMSKTPERFSVYKFIQREYSLIWAIIVHFQLLQILYRIGNTNRNGNTYGVEAGSWAEVDGVASAWVVVLVSLTGCSVESCDDCTWAWDVFLFLYME